MAAPGSGFWGPAAAKGGGSTVPSSTPVGSIAVTPYSPKTDDTTYVGEPKGLTKKQELEWLLQQKTGLNPHRGFFERESKALAGDVVNTLDAAPTGIAQVLNAAYAANPIDPSHFGHVNYHPAAALAKAMAIQTAHDVRHPLRHPGNTALDALAFASLGAGSGLRLAAAARAADAVEAGSTAAKAAAAGRALIRNPALDATRTITVPSGEGTAATFTGSYSRAGLSHVLQKATDKAIQTRAAKGSEFAKDRLYARAAKMNERAGKVEAVKARAAGNRALVAGARLGLDDAQQRALRIVGETVPYPRALKVMESRFRKAAKGLSKAEARLEDATERDLSPRTLKMRRKELNQARLAAKGTEQRLQWTRDAGQYLSEDAEGHPIIHPDHPELADAFEKVAAAAGSREQMLKGLKLMDDDSFQAAKTKVARIAAGANYIKPTAGRLGKIKGLAEERKAVAMLSARFERRIAQTDPTGFGAVTRPRTADEAAARLDDLEREHTKIVDQMAEARFGPISRKEVNERTAENARARNQAAGVNRAGKAAGYTGRKSILRPTIKQERRNMIEQAVGGAIEKNPDHPSFQRWKARSDEIDQLKSALDPDIEDVFGEKGPTRTEELEELRKDPRYFDYRTGRPQLTRWANQAIREMDRRRRVEKAAGTKDYGTVTEFRADHPSVLRLGNALSVRRDNLERLEARADALQMPTGIVGAEDVEAGPNAAYIGSPVEQPRRAGIGKRSTSSNTLGHTANRGSLKEFTGKARISGLERNDVTRLIAERQYEAVGLTHLKRMVERVQGAGTKVPRRADDVFLWTDGKVISNDRLDPEIKNFLQGLHDENVKRDLSDQELKSGGLRDSLKKALLETPINEKWSMSKDQEARLETAAQNGQGVFVPRKLLGRDAPRAGLAATNLSNMKWLSNVNNFEKLGLIYLKVNYPIVQGLSNIALNLIQQGVYAPRNLKLAAQLGKKIGPDVSAMVDDAVEQGLAGQLAGGSKGAFGRFSAGAAHAATIVADKIPRRAAWLHEAYRQGYRTGPQIRSLLTDPDKLSDLVQVTQRAKEAIVDFGDLGPVEKDVIRQLVFVYPWLKGSTVYTGRFLRDHPLQAAALGHLGQLGAERNQAVFGDRPSYDQTLLPVGGRAIDLGSLNPFSTPAQIGQTAAALATGNWNAQPPDQFLSPAAATLVDLARRRDSGNFPLKGNLLVQARNELLSQLPLSQLIASAPGPQQDIARKVLGTPRASKSFPNQQLWLRFLAGGLYPRTFDKAAINKAAAYEASQASR